MSDKIQTLIYGCYGYTGDLIARKAAQDGGKPILAGRNGARVKALADELGLQHRVVGLDDAAALDAALADVAVVIHCAGPFARTSKAMVDACLRTGAHYLDITGELEVFEMAAARTKEAEAAEIMVMPGAGFDVVPSDCLAAHVAGRLKDATQLHLGFKQIGGAISHGTATTVVENLHRGSMVRENGRLKGIRVGSVSRLVDFGRGEKRSVAIPWGDVSTAYHSTGIGNIAVFVPVPWAARIGMRMSGFMGPLLGSGPVQRFLKKKVDAMPAGPTAEQRAKGASILWAEARNDAGEIAVARLRTPEGYELTARTAWAIAKRVAGGDFKTGFQTPSSAYGPDLVLSVEGVEREDL